MDFFKTFVLQISTTYLNLDITFAIDCDVWQFQDSGSVQLNNAIHDQCHGITFEYFGSYGIP